MHLRKILAALLLTVAPALAQTPAAQTPAAQTPAAQTPAASTPAAPPPATPAVTPAPMPDPLMSPSLQQGRTPTLAGLVQQSAWQEPLITAAKAQFKQLPNACAAAAFKPTGDLTVFVPPQFDAQGTLQQGIWLERVIASGCGAPRTLNVLTVLQPGSAPTRVPTMPGSTHADPATQKAALQYAQAVAIRAAPPGCRTQAFVDTRFDSYTGLPNPAITDRDGRAWREVWTLAACGTLYDLTLTFTPNAQGTQLVATNPTKRS